MIAGPEQRAEAINRGATIDAFQNGRAESPLYRKAVTVWILSAQGIEMMTIGQIKHILYTPPMESLYRT